MTTGQEPGSAEVPARPESAGAESAGAESLGAESVGAESVGAESVGAESVGAESVGAAPELIVHPDEQTLADVTAGRLLAAIVDAQSLRGTASVVLTGGGIGIAVLASLAVAPGLGSVDWRNVDLWWGDERWVGDLDPDRNERQAKDALLDRLTLDPARVRPMPGTDNSASPEEAAAAYSLEIAAAATFDVCMLGMGPEGHTASMFPGSPAVREHEALVVGVRNCPKPPPERVSMTLPALRRSREIWLIASGDAKADAIARVMAGASPDEVPAAGARGQQRTLLLVDVQAAAKAQPTTS